MIDPPPLKILADERYKKMLVWYIRTIGLVP